MDRWSSDLVNEQLEIILMSTDEPLKLTEKLEKLAKDCGWKYKDIELQKNYLLKKSKKEKKEEVTKNKRSYESIEKINWKEELENNKERQKEQQLNILGNKVLSLVALRQDEKATEEVTEYILLNNHIKSIKQDKTVEIWFYDDGIYKQNGESQIKELCRKIFGEAYTPQRASKVIAKVQADTFIEADDFFRAEQENQYEAPVLNGILNLKTKELSNFTPEKIFFNKINAKYDPNAECPEIKKHLENVLKLDDDKEVFFEIVGSTLVKKYIVQMAVMFLGEGENGKGITQDLIKHFLGPENCSCVPLNQMTSDSFSVSELFGKLANLAGDISNTDLKETGRFKELRSGTDTISAKRKFMRDLNFINYATLLFSCNELPRVYDMSHGFWRSWLIMEFPYKFLKAKEYNLATDKTNIKKADDDILEKITTPEEMSGLLNEALRGLDKLIRTRQYSFSKSTAEVKDFWIRKSNSFTAFCYDHLVEDPESYESKKKIRKEFSKYCKKHKIKGAGDRDIKATLEDLFGVIETKKVIDRVSYERDNVWEGIRFVGKIEDVKEVNDFYTHSQIGNLHIGSNTLDTIDINSKRSNFTKEEIERAGLTEQDLQEVGSDE